MTITKVQLNHTVKDFFGNPQMIQSVESCVSEETIIRTINKIVRDAQNCEFSAAHFYYLSGAWDTVYRATNDPKRLEVVRHQSLNSQDAPIVMQVKDAKRMLVDALD